MANVLAVFAQFERRLIGLRTREALREKKAHGVRLGRPVELPASVAKRITWERKKGLSLAAIAQGLNEDKVPTAHGGRRWWLATVRAILNRA
jgi:DNA invertase Pin-like site-specific DNA recombinase